MKTPSNHAWNSSDLVGSRSNQLGGPRWFDSSTLGVVTTPASAVAAR